MIVKLRGAIWFVLVLKALVLIRSASAQGFVDLDFESATLVPAVGDPYGAVSFPQAFPGWTKAIVGAIDSNALYDNIFLDSAGISIIDKNAPFNLDSFVFDGRYTAVLQSGFGYTSNGQMPTDTTLSQNGLVPVGTESLQFKANTLFDSLGAFAVTLGGQTLSLTTLGTAANYTVYGANISQWADRTAQLSFTVFGENPHVDDEFLYLDDIQFSSQPIPEPSEMRLFSAFIAFLCWRRMRLNNPTATSPAIAQYLQSRIQRRGVIDPNR
jgi:hypothetical protein